MSAVDVGNHEAERQYRDGGDEQDFTRSAASWQGTGGSQKNRAKSNPYFPVGEREGWRKMPQQRGRMATSQPKIRLYKIPKTLKSSP